MTTLGTNYFSQIGSGDDTLAVLKSIYLSPSKINTSSKNQTYTATVTIFEAAGVEAVDITSWSPSTNNQNTGTCAKSKDDGRGLETWTCKQNLVRGSQKGLHKFTITILDKNQNWVMYWTDENGWLFRGYGTNNGTKTNVLGDTGILNTDQ